MRLWRSQSVWGVISTAFLVLAGCEARPGAGPITYKAERGAFVHEISSRGTVFSQAGTEVRCDVDSQGPEGTMILEIVPEGSSVRPGDRLVQLDTSALKEDLLQQQILCNDLEASVAAAASEREKAQLSFDEYMKGLYPEEKKATEDALFAAEKKLDWAKRTLEAGEGKKQSEDNPAEDVEALRFDVDMAKRDLESAKTRIAVLDGYTKPLRVKQLEGDVESAAATMRAKETELSLQKSRLAKMAKQIEACTLTAPVAGVIFYANAPGETEEDEVLISEGVPVRRRQVILRIAKLDQLSVRVEVAESDIAHLREGMPAMILVDTMADTLFDGHVSKVHPYPTRETRGSTGKKKYEVHVVIDNPSGTLRPGLSAEVILTLAEMDDAVQVPQTSVFEEDGTAYCLVRMGNRWALRPVVAGACDGKMTVIREGVQPGEEVAIHPLHYRKQATQ